MADSRFPVLSARHRFIARDQPVERALRQSQRDVWQRRGIWDRAHELRTPRLTCSAVVANFHAFEVAVGIQRFAGAVPVEKSKIEPRTDYVRIQLRFDLFREQLPRLAVDDTVHRFDRAPVKYGQLKEIRIGYDAGQAPGAGCCHLDLSLQQCLANLQIRKQLSAFEQLGLDLSSRGSLDSSEIVPDDGVACVRR